MERKRREKRQLKRTFIYLFLILVLLVLLTTASYTWFALSQTPRVSDMYMYINAPTGLELAPTADAEEWVQQLDFRDLTEETAPLRPVTWSEADQRFYAAEYGFDGRRTDDWHELSDANNANRDDAFGYYVKATFYARTGAAMDVSLSPAVEIAEGVQGSGTYLVGVPQWDSEEIIHVNGGLGAQNAMRLGFRITPVDNSGLPTGGASQFIIYEPNCDGHLYKEFKYVPTESIDGAETLVSEDRLILQSVSSWREADPVQRSVVIHRLGDFMTDPYLFSIQPEEIMMIDLYVWLEGQDIDCTNEIQAAQIFASVQFKGETANQGGLVPIPG